MYIAIISSVNECALRYTKEILSRRDLEGDREKRACKVN